MNSLQGLRVTAPRLAALLALVAACAPPPPAKAPPLTDPAKATIQDVFVLVTTDQIPACVAFYRQHFGFSIAFESSIYVQMLVPGEASKSFSLAFMPPTHPFPNAGPETFAARGLILTLQVSDARKVHEQVRAAGAPIVYPLKDEAWGQRHFMTRDPAGVTLDVVETIEADPHYYDRFQGK